MSWQFSEDGILSKLGAEKYLIIASLISIFTSNDSANLRNFKKTENFQRISLLNLITVNILKKSEYWLNIQPVSVSVSRREIGFPQDQIKSANFILNTNWF